MHVNMHSCTGVKYSCSEVRAQLNPLPQAAEQKRRQQAKIEAAEVSHHASHALFASETRDDRIHLALHPKCNATTRISLSALTHNTMLAHIYACISLMQKAFCKHSAWVLETPCRCGTARACARAPSRGWATDRFGCDGTEADSRDRVRLLDTQWAAECTVVLHILR